MVFFGDCCCEGFFVGVVRLSVILRGFFGIGDVIMGFWYYRGRKLVM